MIDFDSSAVESKNFIFFAVQFLKNRKFASCLNFDVNWIMFNCVVWNNCRNSLFNRFIFVSIVAEMIFDKVCICSEIKLRFDKLCLENCSTNITANCSIKFWKISIIFDQIIEILFEFEKSCLMCLTNVKDNCSDLFSVNEKVENCDAIFSNSLNFWKIWRYFLLSFKIA